jgi:sulfate adenylyltransferase subunit 1 (EFTu-like GTPase family)
MKKTASKKGYDYLDFSLADGLVAERTRNHDRCSAYLFFCKESYIIADTPGHVGILVTWLRSFNFTSIDHFD